jgi:Protein of unknown function (DUF4230)
MDSFFTLFSLLLALAIGAGIGWWLKKPKSAPQVSTTIHSSLEDLRAIGELSVFKAITKEIVTETGHTFGDFGRKYLSWAFSKKKLAMIFEFDIDFRYDLRRPDFMIDVQVLQPSGIRQAAITLPPCQCAVNIRDIHFYDEQKSAALPWLLPSLIGEAFGSGFDEVDKNRLIAAAREHAQKEAQILIDKLKPEVERSARTTLVALAQSFGVKEVRIAFQIEQITAPLPELTSESGALELVA